jgi:predicted protein tyrosine phosphatase
MEEKIEDKGCKFKIVDVDMDLLDHCDDKGIAHYKDPFTMSITLITNIPIYTVFRAEDFGNRMKNMFLSLINDKKMKKLLFVCERNEQRSPSFQIWFEEHRPEYDVRSTGTANGYPETINRDLLEWADRVFLMDLEQERFIGRKFPDFLYKTEIIGCSDQYQRGSPQLTRVIEYWVRKRGL